MHRAKRTELLYALLFTAPFLVYLLVFHGYAFVRAVFFSLTNKDLFNTPSFVGLANYVYLFRDERFLLALQHSVSFTVVVTVLQTFLALVMAAIVNQKIRGIIFFRTVYYVPSILSSAAVTLIAIWFFQRNGFLNSIIGWFGAYGPVILAFLGIFVLAQAAQVMWERSRGLPVGVFDPALAALSLLVAIAGSWILSATGWVTPREAAPFDLAWLSETRSFLGIPIPLWAIILLNTFTTIPTLMLIFLAGLQDIPRSVYEAAAIDGASPVQQFFHITIPMLRPVSFLVITLSLIGTLQMFDQVALLGNASSLDSIITLAYFVYNNVFNSNVPGNVGIASAGALLLALLTFAIVGLQRAFGISEKGY
ncbi:MAG: sugar ABC transporter permease [Meiothermus silvanus]|nr:sugar ABC transporter permease [Allomeiothermus silvanus]